MVISKEQLQENENFIKNCKTPFLVLDMRHFPYFKDIEKFGFAVEVLNVLNSIAWMNQVCKDLNSGISIKTEIFYEIIESLFTARNLNTSQLERYLETQQDLYEISIIFDKLVDIDRNFDLPFEIDFILLGGDFEKYENLGEEKKAEILDDYIFIFSKIKAKKIEFEDFVMQAQALIATVNGDYEMA